MSLLTRIREHESLTRRTFWIVMGLGHLPALWDASNSLAVGHGASGNLVVEGVGRFLGLALTTLFIALKIRDVGFMRLCAGRRSLIAAGLVIALLHVDVVRPMSQASAIPDVTMLAATVWIVAIPTSTRARLVACFARVHTLKKDRVQAHRFIGTAWLDSARPHCWLLSRTLFLMRAPPI